MLRGKQAAQLGSLGAPTTGAIRGLNRWSENWLQRSYRALRRDSRVRACASGPLRTR